MMWIHHLTIGWLLVLGKEISTKDIGMRESDLEINYDDIEVKGLGIDNNDKEVIEYTKRQDISQRSETYNQCIYSHNHVPQESFAQKGPSKPQYGSFMKTIKDSSSEITGCPEGGFACVIFPNEINAYLQNVGQSFPNSIGTFKTTPAPASTLSSYTGPTKHEFSNILKLSAYFLKFGDPDWWKQWYMHDYRDTDTPVMDHNLVPVYNEKFKGRKITVALLGEGIVDHKDLRHFDKSVSYNFCEDSFDPSPDFIWDENTQPLYYSEGNLHAGLIGMSEDNNICGVGVAPYAIIASYKMRLCDHQENVPEDLDARALRYRTKTVDIFCNTWTVDDKRGMKLTELSPEVDKSLKEGTTHGRQGFKSAGSIYVFPSGKNRILSNCATNGYVNNPYGITIASANQAGKPASYSERCSAVFATAYSGDKGMNGIETIDANKNCATYFTNTPAGATVACGIIALLLESSKYLSYRDVMHVISMTAEVAPLADNEDTWYRNGAGFWVSNDFGFGLLNAGNLINLSAGWNKVTEEHVCVLNKKLDEPVKFDHTENKVFTIDAGECSEITYLEHVELQFSASYSCRGAIHIYLTSPAGMETKLLEMRRHDFSNAFKDWNIMSIQNWGEDPKGTWSVTFKAHNLPGLKQPHGHIEDFVLKLHGLKEVNDQMKNKRTYAAFRLPNGKTSEDKI